MQKADEGVEAKAQATMREMVAEVAASPPLYRPSKFWVDLNQINQAMLDELGLDNLKRTVAQNYFNWLVTSRLDPQYQAVRRLWARRPTLRPYLNRMTEPRLLKTLQPYLGRLKEPSMAVTAMGTAPTIGRRELRIYKLFVGMLWEYAVQEYWSDISERTVEPMLGNPIELYRLGKLISQDLANSIREYNAILSGDRELARSGKRVAELGAGYGRLGHVFLSDGQTKYFIFDLPPALFVSQWYLSTSHPGKAAFSFRHFERFSEIEQELKLCDVAFFTPNQMALFPDGYFDIFASISTLPEMAPDQISNYLIQAERLSARYIYLKQWLDWENPADGHRVSLDTMRLGKRWHPFLDRKDAVQPQFFERLWRSEPA